MKNTDANVEGIRWEGSLRAEGVQGWVVKVVGGQTMVVMHITHSHGHQFR